MVFFSLRDYPYPLLPTMAVKAVRSASKPRSAKKAAKRATRRAARKARSAAKPKAPKAVRTARKAKRVTKKSQTGTLRKVWNGTKVYTKSGLTKKDLIKTKSGKVMSKKQFKNGQRCKKTGWIVACAKARKELGITGFVVMNRGAEGRALYKAAKSYM
jgi:hypothetical protein